MENKHEGLWYFRVLFRLKKKMLILIGGISMPGRKMGLPRNSGETDLYFSSLRYMDVPW